MKNGKIAKVETPSAGRQSSAFFQPLAVAVLFVVFSLLFFATAIMHIDRVERALLDVQQSKGLNVIESVEWISRNKFKELMSLPEMGSPVSPDGSWLEAGLAMRESMAWRLIQTAREIDFREAGGLLSREAVAGIIEAEHLLGLIILNDQGKNIYQAGKVPEAVLRTSRPLLAGKVEILIDLFGRHGENGTFGLVGLRRKTGNGAILLILDRQGLLFWRSRVAIQDAVEEGAWRKDVHYFVVHDAKGRILAGAGEFPQIDRKITEGQTGGPRKQEGYRRLTVGASGILEVYAPLRLDEGLPATARVGLDMGRMDDLIQKNRTHVFLSAGVMMFIALIAVWLYYRNQQRHLLKLHEMGERMHQAERLSSLGNLAAGVAHEIRNPLNAIGMAAQRIQREYGRPDNGRDDDLQRFTGLIRDEVGRLNRIVEDFLGLSRNRFELRSQSIVELLERLIHLFREEADARKIRIETRWEDADPVVLMDADKMKQALLNIIKNALESIVGPGTLGFRVGGNSKKYVSIQISDTGPGIAIDMQKEMFSPHFTTKDKGLGLGLPIAYEIVRAHGGEIRVHSAPGRGSVFEILVPRERTPYEES